MLYQEFRGTDPFEQQIQSVLEFARQKSTPSTELTDSTSPFADVEQELTL